MTIQPEPARWPRGRTCVLPEAHRRFRQQLGFATDRPVVLSGHQAALWHAGILAKVFAARAWAAQIGGSAGWVVVDQDPEDFTALRVPVRNERGRLTAATARLASKAVSNELAADVAPGCLPTFDPVTPHLERPALAELPGRLERVVTALRAAKAGARTAAEQVTGALGALCPGGLPGVVYATKIADTDLFASIAARMREEPRRCHDAYNAALAQSPGARLTPLGTPGGRIELPLWSLDGRTGARRRVFADMLGAGEHARLAPRALLLTGLLRLAGCEVFIHGLGGGASQPGPGGYDRAAEAWLGAWLGATLAPSVVVSATVTLPLASGPVVSEAEAARAVWRAHAATHDPGQVGDRDRAERKARLVSQIQAAPRRSAARAGLFAQLHALVAEHRSAHPAELSGLAGAARQAHAARMEQVVALERTWSIGLLDPAALEELDRRVRGSLTP